MNDEKDKAFMVIFFGGIGVLFAVTFLGLLLYFIICCHRDRTKSRIVGPITKTPIVPFNSSYLTKKDHLEKGIRFLCGIVKYDIRNPTSMIGKLRKALQMESDVPVDARVISVKMKGFNFGTDCQSFEPMDGMGSGSYYTYQMFGDNRIQVTNYVKDGTSYVAGFVIYIKYGCVPFTRYPLEVIKQFMESPKYKCTRLIIERRAIPVEEIKTRIENETIQIERETTNEVEIENWSVKMCGKLRRNVMTIVIDGSAYHQEWNPILLKMKSHKCTECSENVEEDLLPPEYSSLSMV